VQHVTLTEARAAPTPTDAELLIEEARHRRRRRWTAAGASILALGLVAVLAVSATPGGPQGPRPPRPPHRHQPLPRPSVPRFTAGDTALVRLADAGLHQDYTATYALTGDPLPPDGPLGATVSRSWQATVTQLGATTSVLLVNRFGLESQLTLTSCRHGCGGYTDDSVDCRRPDTSVAWTCASLLVPASNGGYFYTLRMIPWQFAWALQSQDASSRARGAAWALPHYRRFTRPLGAVGSVTCLSVTWYARSHAVRRREDWCVTPSGIPALLSGTTVWIGAEPMTLRLRTVGPPQAGLLEPYTTPVQASEFPPY
jgi:hypothetical protein